MEKSSTALSSNFVGISDVKNMSNHLGLAKFPLLLELFIAWGYGYILDFMILINHSWLTCCQRKSQGILTDITVQEMTDSIEKSTFHALYEISFT